METDSMKATAVASSNIAFIKYWGKRDTALILPMNASISMTLDDGVSTTTTVEFSGSLAQDELVLNYAPTGGTKLERVSRFLDILRQERGISTRAKVVSINTFPTGSGIASSASGFAALAVAASGALSLSKTPEELSALARQGSGSACRSVIGGFSEWDDTYAVQLQPETHWPELRDVILLVSAEEKTISSRQGMEATVETSALYKERIKNLPIRLGTVRDAIADKDFSTLSTSIMEDSDELHACIADTTPSVRYLTEDSLRIIEAVKRLNSDGEMVAAYTFDAGPNAHIITKEEHLPKILEMIGRLGGFPHLVSGLGEGARLIDDHLF
ncbi:MAG: diphosphomevalonate decarboxylase [archaeon]